MLSGKPISDHSDQELLQHYRQSHEAGIVGHLFTRYSALVYGVCLKYLKDREEAKDAVMSIFEKLTTSLLEHEIAHFKSWLYVTSRNHCLMQLRSRKGRHTEEIGHFLMENDGLGHQDDAIELEANLVKLERCMERLVAEQKQCVRLFYLQQKCYQEISVETRFNLKQVKSYIQNGKRNLKICMERND